MQICNFKNGVEYKQFQSANLSWLGINHRKKTKKKHVCSKQFFNLVRTKPINRHLFMLKLI